MKVHKDYFVTMSVPSASGTRDKLLDSFRWRSSSGITRCLSVVTTADGTHGVDWGALHLQWWRLVESRLTCAHVTNGCCCISTSQLRSLARAPGGRELSVSIPHCWFPQNMTIHPPYVNVAAEQLILRFQTITFLYEISKSVLPAIFLGHLCVTAGCNWSDCYISTFSGCCCSLDGDLRPRLAQMVSIRSSSQDFGHLRHHSPPHRKHCCTHPIYYILQQPV